MEQNLQSRLDAAREARRKTAPADPPSGDESPEPPQVIDLTTLRSVREAAKQARSADEPPRSWDSSPMASMTLLLQRQAALRGEAIPTTSPAQEGCPTCGGSVRIDMYDLVASVAHLTCLDCGFLFSARSPHT